MAGRIECVSAARSSGNDGNVVAASVAWVLSGFSRAAVSVVVFLFLAGEITVI
jgi:hypothetical protein